MSTDVPPTEAELKKWMGFQYSPLPILYNNDAIRLIREVQRLRAELAEERARMDWVLTHPSEFRALIWDSEDESEPNLRAGIDEARKEGI